MFVFEFYLVFTCGSHPALVPAQEEEEEEEGRVEADDGGRVHTLHSQPGYGGGRPVQTVSSYK